VLFRSGAVEERRRLGRRACLTRAAGSLAAKEIETFHDRIRELVVELLGDEERRARHRALAEAIEAFGGGRDDEDDAALAMHWLAAGERERAARHSEGAALRAEAALAFDQAASLLRQALELSAPSEARRLQALLGDALARAGKSREAATALLAAVDGADAEQALALQRRAAEQLLRGGHLADGAEVIRRALASVGLAYPATPRRALAALLWRRGRLRWRGLDFVERPAASIAPELLARLDMCWAAGQGLGYTDMVRGMGFQSRHLQLALDAGDPYRVVRGIGVEAIFVASTGDAKQAAALVERAAALAERTGRPECRVWVELGAAMTALCAYRWPEALAAAQRVPVLAAGHEAEMRWEISTGQYVSLLALLYSGRVAEVARRVPEAFAEAEDRGDLYTEATLGTYPQPWFLVAQDRPDEAQAALDHAVVRWCNEGFHLQHLGHFLATAELQLYRGDAAAAVDGLRRGWRAMERSQLLRVRFLGVRAREILGRAAAASAGGPDDPILGESERMARWLEREGSAWTRLLATLIRGLIAQRRGDDALALARFEEAERGADACKSALHAAALRRQRGVLAGLGDLVAGADDDMRAMGVRAPARYADMLVPLAARRTASS